MSNLGYIQVTRRCNQACIFCSNPEMELDMTLDQARRLVDDLRQRGYAGIIITGGEPTLWEPLPELVAYAASTGIASRMITNGQRLADETFFESLHRSGLGHVHFSVHSVRPDVQAGLACNEPSLPNLYAAIGQAGRLGVTANINVVINARNADHLDEIAAVLTDRFPFVRHFIFNNIDPTMNRAAEHPEIVPRLQAFEVSLHRAMNLLSASGRSFRVERVPLCYMAEFAEFSTETRKIVKEEERVVHFLDGKGTVRQTDWGHAKADCCRVCRLDPVCAGLYELGTFYDPAELFPVFLDPDEIRRRVRSSPD